MEEPVLGIDIGTSNSLIGMYQADKVELVPNSIGDKYTSSIVDILEEGEFIGEDTFLHKMNDNNYKNRITGIKSIIGRQFSSLTTKEKEKYNVIEDPKNKDQILIKIIRKDKEEYLTPENIMALIFKKLIKNASDLKGSSINKAVITIPSYFDYNQRCATIVSANYAGIEVLNVVDELTSAVFAYGLENKINNKVLVFNLGSEIFNASILNIENNEEIRVISSLSETNLGGDNFDYKLVDFSINKFCRLYQIDEDAIRKDKNIIIRLKTQCEKSKKKLSNYKKTSIIINNFFKDLNLYIDITRDEFDLICEDLYERIKIILNKIIIDSKLSLEEIDEIILLGGSSRIPKIKNILAEKFGERKIKGQISPDEVVAIGATMQAHEIIKSNKRIYNINITPFSLGFGVISKIPQEQKQGLIMSILVPKYKEIPCRSEIKTYKTVEDNQKYFRILLYGGENKFCKNNNLLKEFEIKNLPERKAGEVFMQIYLEINREGILYINAEVGSILKVTEMISLFKKSIPSNFVNLKNEGKEIFSEIKKLIDIIKTKKELLETLRDDEQRFQCFKELAELYSKLIEKYKNLNEENNPDILYQKFFSNYREILKCYSEMIIITKDEKIIEDLINKITAIFSELIYDDLESLINIFDDLKEKKQEEYNLIILQCADILYKKGENILSEGKKYSIYYARKYISKADKIKSLIEQNKFLLNDKLIKINEELKSKYLKKKILVDPLVRSVYRSILLKNNIIIGTGFTAIGNIIENLIKKENSDYLNILLDIFKEEAETLSEDKNNFSEKEAFCLVNIIIIKFSRLKYQSVDDIKYYKNLINRIEFIIDRLDLDEESNWLSKYNELKEEIEEKKERDI